MAAPTRETITALTKRFLADKEVWHDTQGEAYVTLKDGRNIKIQSREMNSLIHIFKRDGSNSTRQNLRDLVLAEALENGKTYETFIRVSDKYLDLGNKYIELATLKTLDRVDQKFIRFSSLGQLPLPDYSGTIEDLTDLLGNIQREDYPLIKGAAIAAMRHESPHFILALGGSAGSAKTTAQRIITSCIDPRAGNFDSQSSYFSSRDPRDLDAIAFSQHCISLDNLSTLSPTISDRIAAYSTGGAISTRMLYTNGEIYTRPVAKPIFLNGIGEIVTRPDLLSRSIIVNCDLVEHRDLRDVEAEFYERQPKILGAILKHVQQALTGPQWRSSVGGRMASAVSWIRSSGIEDFESRYQQWLQESDVRAIDMSPVGTYIYQLIQTWQQDRDTNERKTKVQKELRAVLGLYIPEDCFITTWSSIYNSHKGEIDWPRTEIGFATSRKMIQRNLINLGIDWEEHSILHNMIKYVIIGPIMSLNEVRKSKKIAQ